MIEFVYWRDVRVGDCILDSSHPHVMIGIVSRISNFGHVIVNEKPVSTRISVLYIDPEGVVRFEKHSDDHLTWCIKRGER